MSEALKENVNCLCSKVTDVVLFTCSFCNLKHSTKCVQIECGHPECNKIACKTCLKDIKTMDWCAGCGMHFCLVALKAGNDSCFSICTVEEKESCINCADLDYEDEFIRLYHLLNE